MTGLEKIISKINEDAVVEAKAVIAEAEEKAKEIILQAKEDGKEKQAEIAKDSDGKIKILQSRAESAAVLEKKKIKLQSKNDMINQVIDSAKETLRNADKDEYFDIILKLVKKHSQDAAGEIIFSKDDLDRLPTNMEEKIAEALEDKPKASLTISKQARNINGGCLLVYGDIEENCSFDALFRTSMDDFQDSVSQVLFK